ncbi:Tannase [Dactylella cylindrospora]|nr:Tannase [Dactylella cylindrospora]
MRSKYLFSILIFSLLANLPFTLGTGNNFQRRCTRLTESFKVANTNVIASGYVTKNTNLTFPDAHPSCPQSMVVLADICRLQLNVTTSATSSVVVEVWLPVDWEEKGKRFLMTGNAGLDGCVASYDMAYTTFFGFATIGHNNGHDGDTGLPFLNRPEVVRDFSYRALEVATKVGKAAVNLFYKDTLSKSYFLGCSTGGRQGLKAAQSFPDEYDGIVAGAPSLDSNNLGLSNGRYGLLVGTPGSPTYLTLDQWMAVNAGILAQCDDIDGAKDGVLEDPMKCRFRPESLLCAPGQTWESDKCLTATQVSTVRQIYEPFYGNGGKLLFPRMQPGGETIGYQYLYNGAVNSYSEDFLRYAVYNDPSWDFRENYSLDVADHVNELDPFGISTNNPDLSGFQASGGKLLVYHGLSDGLITAENSYRYYESVGRNMSLPSGQLDSFYRFFPISGMDHCYGGSGAWYVGGPLQIAFPGATQIPADGGVLMGMVRWVEEGVAPETVTGFKFGTTGIVGVREHCKWPKQAKYKGTGDPDAKENWECK